MICVSCGVVSSLVVSCREVSLIPVAACLYSGSKIFGSSVWFLRASSNGVVLSANTGPMGPFISCRKTQVLFFNPMYIGSLLCESLDRSTPLGKDRGPVK